MNPPIPPIDDMSETRMPDFRTYYNEYFRRMPGWTDGPTKMMTLTPPSSNDVPEDEKQPNDKWEAPSEELLVKEDEYERTVKPITVNKLLLASQSPYFYTLFFKPFKEKATKHFEIVEPKGDALEVMFELLDPGKVVQVTVDNVDDQLELSDKYDVPAVHDKCVRFLLSGGQQHMMFRLRMADKYSLPDVEQCCIDLLRSESDYGGSVSINPNKGKAMLTLRKNIVREKADFNLLSDQLKVKVLDYLVLE